MKLWRSAWSHPLGAMLLVGSLQVAAYLWAGLDAREGPGYALPQPDTFFYCQAARRIVEGHPFSFSEGTAVSTGTTTVAYPFVLAVPYALGCTGDAMLLAGFVLNAAFYLVFLVSWGTVIRRKFRDDPGGGLVAGLLTALFGQVAYTVFAQSDIGFWLATSSLLAAGLATGSRKLVAVTLAAAPWVRPEGMVCCLAFALFVPFAPRGERRREAAVAAIGVLSAAGVFALNLALTGEAQFASVVQKGYFRNLPFAEAARATLADVWENVRDFGLGLPAREPVRAWYFPPLVAAAALWIGVFARRWKGHGLRHELVWLTAVAGGYATLVTSGWQNTNVDRYLSWTMPTLLLFAAAGASAVARRLPFPRVRWLFGAALVAMTAVDALVMLAIFRASVAGVDLERAFAVRMETAMEKGASVGALCNCSMAYALSPRRFVHLAGVYSPEMRVPIGTSSFDKLKNEPRLRFAYWYDEGFLGKVLDPDELARLGERKLADGFGHALYRADWSAFDRAAEPPCADGLKPVDRVDVGYGEDEVRTGFGPVAGGRPPTPVFVKCGPSPSGVVIDAGRIVRDGFSANLALRHGKDAVLVLRVSGSGKAYAFDGRRRQEKVVRFPAAAEIRLSIDGRAVRPVLARLTEDAFADVRIPVDGHLIAKDAVRVDVRGEFAVFSIWASQ